MDGHFSKVLNQQGPKIFFDIETETLHTNGDENIIWNDISYEEVHNAVGVLKNNKSQV